MLRNTWLLGLAVLVGAIPGAAQVAGGQNTGGLPQTVEWGLQQAMRDLEAKSLGITEETMAEEVGADVLAAFVEGAVVRLVLSPGGAFTAYTLEGGELVSFKLGKETVAVSGEEEWQDPWVAHRGTYTVPKRPQKLTMSLDAQDQQVEVECYNKFRPADTDVTYYVGPLNGLFCMGLTDEDGG